MFGQFALFLLVSALVIVTPGQAASATERLRARAAYRQGVISNLGNPKMAVFFTSLLPQFAHSFGGLLGLGVVFCCLTLAWLSAYAVAVARARNILRRPPVRR